MSNRRAGEWGLCFVVQLSKSLWLSYRIVLYTIFSEHDITFIISLWNNNYPKHQLLTATYLSFLSRLISEWMLTKTTSLIMFLYIMFPYNVISNVSPKRSRFVFLSFFITWVDESLQQQVLISHHGLELETFLFHNNFLQNHSNITNLS